MTISENFDKFILSEIIKYFPHKDSETIRRYCGE